MMRNFSVLVCLFLCGILTISAQPSATDVPNPASDYIPSTGYNTTVIYGSAGNPASFAGDPGLSIVGYGSGKGAVQVLGLATGAYPAINLGVNITPGSGSTRLKNIYFVYAEAVNDLIIEASDQGIWWQPIGFRQLATYTNGWKLGVATVPDNITRLSKLYFQLNGDAGNGAYLANICISNYEKVDYPTIAPTNPPALPSCTYLSVYNETPYNTPSPAWSIWNGESAAFSVTGGEVRKVTLDASASPSGASADITINNAGQDLRAYQYVYFDLWLPTAKKAGDFEVQLKHTSYGGAGSDYGELITRLVRNDSDDDADNTDLPAEQWISVRMSLDKFEVPEWSKITYNEVISAVKTLSIAVAGNSAETTFYVDNIYFYSPTDPDRAPEEAPYESSEVVSVYGQYGNASMTWTNKTDFTDPSGNVSAKIDFSAASPSSISVSPALSLGSGNIANMLYMNVWVGENCSGTKTLKIKLNGTSNEYTVPAGALRAGKWNTFNIPMRRFADNITSISGIQFSGSGVFYVDDIFFYYEELNPDPVAELYIDNVFQGDFYSIGEAVSAVPTVGMQGKQVEVAVIRDSNEPRGINIPIGDWDLLTFYPKNGARTVVFTSNSGRKTLFSFENNAKNVTFNGKMNKTGASLSLIVKGKYIPSDVDRNDFNTVISGYGVANVTVTDCMFEGSPGSDITNRPESVISTSGTHMKVTNNHFKDCLFLGKIHNFANNSLLAVYTEGSTNHYWEISGNHFYESNPIDFTSPIFRKFISFGINDPAVAGDNSNTVKIVNNKFGGNGRDASGNIIGRMVIGQNMGTGYDYDPISDPENTANKLTASSVFCIDMGINSANGNNYTLIANNEIANIDIINPTAGMFRRAIDPTDPNMTIEKVYEPYYMGEFTGVAVTGGKIIVKDNDIYDVTNTARSRIDSNQPDYKYSYVTLGIRSENWGGNTATILDGNKIYNIYGDLLFDDKDQNGLIAGIDLIQQNTWSSRMVGVIRNNRIMLGHKGNVISNLSVKPITTVMYEVSADASILQDIYDNICAIDEIKYTRGNFASVDLIDIAAQATNDNGVINCYNNIAYLQPKAADSFNGVTSTIGGIRYTASSGVANFFHNTVLLKNINMIGASDLMSLYFTGENGKLNVWNNNFVNLNTVNSGVIFTNDVAPKEAAYVYFDYNNYYIPETGDFLRSAGLSRTTFDDWKFSNPLSYFNRTTEHDFHSRFLVPEFISENNIDLTTISELESLRENLIPKRFLGGKKTADDFLSKLFLNSFSADVNNNITVNETAVMSDATNLDFAAQTTGGSIVDNKTVRRPNLPTMGALNTAFSNYWTGSGWAIKVPDTGNADSWERDIVFAQAATGGLTLSSNMSVHDVYNDTQYLLDAAGNRLTVTGYIGLEGSGKSTINMAGNGSSIVYAGNDGHDVTENDTPKGAAAQHIFKNTFVGNQVNNLNLNNQSNYFVLLHGELSTEPTDMTLDILNDLSVYNPSDSVVTYPDGTTTGKHIGGLNAVWYKTNLRFSGYTAGNLPDLSLLGAYSVGDTSTYRPYIGQRIPRHGIFNDTVYNLISNSNKLVTYQDYLYTNNLTVTSGNNFEVAADKYVKVLGTTANNAGNSGLTIKSREEKDEDEFALESYLFPTLGETTPRTRPNATFIYRSTTQGQAEIDGTVEMYSPAQKYDTPKESSNGIEYQYIWQYFTPAVRDLASSVFSGTVYEWNPKGDKFNPWTPGSPYWIPVTTMDIQKGYTISQDAPKVYNMTGKLPNDKFTVPASYLTYYVYNHDNDPNAVYWPDQSDNAGKFVVGNPYTYAMSISDLTFPADFEKTVYIYNAGGHLDWLAAGGGSSAYFGDQPGENIVVPYNLAGTEVGGKMLPEAISSMQGFTIKFLDGAYPHGTAANGTFESLYITDKTNPVTDGKNTDKQRSSRSPADTCMVFIELKNGVYYDELLLVSHSDTKKGFDNGWDGRKSMNLARALSLFTIEQEEDLSTSYYQISTMDDFDKTNLGIAITDNVALQSKLEPEHEMVFKTRNLNKFYSEIYLEDLKTGDLVDLLAEGDITYNFSTDAFGEIQNRFRIVTVPQTSDIGDVPDDDVVIDLYNQGKTIFITNPKGLSGMITMYDLTGKPVLKRSLDTGRHSSITTDLVAGTYVVRIVADSNVVTKKVMLK